MARHAELKINTGVMMHFCDPHSPQQRGPRESTEGLIRQYLPESMDLSVHSPGQLDVNAYLLDNVPRVIHGFYPIEAPSIS